MIIKSLEITNHLLNIDGTTLFAKDEKESNTLMKQMNQTLLKTKNKPTRQFTLGYVGLEQSSWYD